MAAHFGAKRPILDHVRDPDTDQMMHGNSDTSWGRQFETSEVSPQPLQCCHAVLALVQVARLVDSALLDRFTEADKVGGCKRPLEYKTDV